MPTAIEAKVKKQVDKSMVNKAIAEIVFAADNDIRRAVLVTNIINE